MPPRSSIAVAVIVLVLGVFSSISSVALTVAIPTATNTSPRVQFAADKLAEAVLSIGHQVTRGEQLAPHDFKIAFSGATGEQIPREGFRIETVGANKILIMASDDSGSLYGALELANIIRSTKSLPIALNIFDAPVMTLRGACVGMQKTYILPDRKVYEYPYTPELFPWFYDKELWREYLDSLVANRMNTLYLWNGHPFASLVTLVDYPEAIEVPPEVFEKNVEMFHWLTTECDKRGIWLVQMFYNIFLPKPLAEKHGVSTQLAAPTPLASDYTRKSIAEFVKQYPNVGLLVCLGEALQDTENQIIWATNTILPGVLDGMRAAGLKEQPPVIIRTHAMQPEAIMPECHKVYTNLFTMTKYTGESLTTYEPRGKVMQTHQNMAKLGPHIANVHILSNLEPFRYGAQRFIKKSVQAARERYHASGLHLYPLAYWNWPYSPDIADPPLKQWERDWIWFEAWARYAWNPNIPEDEDRKYWIDRLAEFYGCDTSTAANILDAYNDAGEVAPMLIRRFGITEGNRQTLALGMTLDQLVNPQRYNPVKDLWESMAPPGERLDEYVRKEWNKEPHVGETPRSVIEECRTYASNAVARLRSVATEVKTNRWEFDRFANDTTCMSLLADYFEAKVGAAERVLWYGYSTNLSYLEHAEKMMVASRARMALLEAHTRHTYHFANSMQTGHRKIPFGGAAHGMGTNYHWTHVLPLYEKELTDFKAHVAELKNPSAQNTKPIAAWPAAKFKLISTNAETYEVKLGARPFTDRKYVFNELAPELHGLTGVRFSHEEAKNHRHTPIEFEVAEPVRVLIGYFNEDRDIWLQVPNLDFASHADERGGVEPVLRNAAAIDECPNVNVHAFRYEPGRHKLELIGRGSFVVLGIVPQSVELKKRDARLGMR